MLSAFLIFLFEDSNHFRSFKFTVLSSSALMGVDEVVLISKVVRKIQNVLR
jgi:hypothetical protein